jgi:hypothetical protein
MSQFHPYPEPKLTIELVPSTQWEDNLRSRLTKVQWDSLRAACYQKAGHRCEVCGGRGRKHPVECHEIWDYEDHALIQRLTGLIALCPDCHKVKHIGFAITQGKAEFMRAINQLAAVNQWPLDLAIEYVDRQFQIHAIRSRRSYHLDLSWLDDSASYFERSEEAARDKRSQLAAATLARLASASKSH